MWVLTSYDERLEIIKPDEKWSAGGEPQSSGILALPGLIIDQLGMY